MLDDLKELPGDHIVLKLFDEFLVVVLNHAEEIDHFSIPVVEDLHLGGSFPKNTQAAPSKTSQQQVCVGNREMIRIASLDFPPV